MPKISLSGPAQLLAAIPYHLGFRPARSVVVVCFHDKRIGLMARLDAADSKNAATAAASLLPALVREAPTSVAIVGFEESAGETRPLSDALAAGLGLERILLRERLLVRDGRWFGLGCDCCPAGGSPMPADADVPALATFVGLGQAVLGTRDAMTRLIEPLDPLTPGHDALVTAISDWQESYAWSLVTDANEQLGALVSGGSPTAERDVADGFRSHTDDEVDEDGPPRRVIIDTALLCWHALLCDEITDTALQAMVPQLVGPLRFAELRDAVIAWICPGTMRLEHVDPDLVAQLRLCLGEKLRGPEQSPDRLRGHLRVAPPEQWPELPPAQDWAAVLAPREVAARMERLCRATPSPHAAPLLSVLAAYAWWAGNGTKAGMAVDRALEIEGEHRLCGLIRTALDHGVRAPLPGWAA